MRSLAVNSTPKDAPAKSIAPVNRKQEPDPAHITNFPGSIPDIRRKNFCPCDGACPRCIPFQTKLKIGQSNDRYEQEAGCAAGRVMPMSEPLLAGNIPLIQKQGFGRQVVKCTRKVLRNYKRNIFNVRDGGPFTLVFNTCPLRWRLWPGGAYKRVDFSWRPGVKNTLNKKLKALANKKGWRQPRIRSRTWTMIHPVQDGSVVHVEIQLYRYISEHRAEEYCINTQRTRPVFGFFEVTNQARVLRITKIKKC